MSIFLLGVGRGLISISSGDTSSAFAPQGSRELTSEKRAIEVDENECDDRQPWPNDSKVRIVRLVMGVGWKWRWG